MPSQAVRDDVVRVLHVDTTKVRAVYEAPAARYRPMDRAAAEAVAARYTGGGPFVLSVGSLEPGKNRGRLIRALHELRQSGIDVPLLVVGQKAWRYDDDFALVRDLGMKDRVTFAFKGETRAVRIGGSIE